MWIYIVCLELDAQALALNSWVVFEYYWRALCYNLWQDAGVNSYLF